MHIQQIRNATVVIQYAGKKFLIDPMLAEKDRYDALKAGIGEDLRNPTVELPMTVDQIFEGIDAVILTHLHLDHYDEVAKEVLPKDIQIFVQNEQNAEQVKADGFLNVEVLTTQTTFEEISLFKTQGEHGRGETLLTMMGQVSGIVFKHPDEKTLYVAGDTVWYEGVQQEIETHAPDIMILNAGNNSIQGLGSIVMDANDVYEVHQAAPNAVLISVHMEAVNHWVLSRQDLKHFAQQKGFSANLLVPENGESYVF